MTAEELLKIMGFEHEDKTFASEDENGQAIISRYHLLSHPHIPGFLLGHRTLEGCAKSAVWAIKTLSIMNELKVRSVKS